MLRHGNMAQRDGKEPAMNKPRILFRAAILAATMCAATASRAADDVAATLARHNIQEAGTAVRQSAGWKQPRKVLLLQWGFRPIDEADFKAVARGATVVSAPNASAAIREAVDADVIIGHNPEICDARIINAASDLRWLASLSAGVELCANVPALKAKRTLVTNMRGIDSPIIAEHAIAMLLALSHSLDLYAVDNTRASWGGGRSSNAASQIQFLEGKTMLVSGLGGIGTEVARRAHGLGMKVVGTRVGGGAKPAFVDYIGQPDELLTLAKTADVVVSCVPLTPETTGLYDERFFAVLKPSAYFINVARGRSVVTDALVKALNEGKLAGAGLDVVDPEPLPAGHPLWKAPRVLITPHISAQSDFAVPARWIVAVENLRRYAAGERMLNVVDLDRGF
jgi:phosphoglycerate dehydrogenase-like enzyme